MKSPDAIRDRVRFLLTEELDRRQAEAQRRLPHLCSHNRRHSLDHRKTVGGDPNPSWNHISRYDGDQKVHLPVQQTMGLCFYGADSPEDWQGTICEDPIDAQRCPLFDALTSKEEVLYLFTRDTSDLHWLREHMPEVYSLLWVLDEPEVITVPWWRRVLYRLLRWNPEPLRTVDPLALPPEV